MPNIPTPITCNRSKCQYNDGAGLCIFEKPLLERREAYVHCLTQKNKVE